MSALIKIPCALVISTCLHVAHTSPSKPTADERYEVDALPEKVIKFVNSLNQYRKTLFWMLGAVETAAIVFTTLLPNQQVASWLVKNGDGTRLYLTPLSITGLVLIISGALLRFQCFRALKSLFTFELSIRKDHKLVTTWPYNVVRHPSYAGMLAIHIGAYCWCGSRGSWLRESGFFESIAGRIVVIVFATCQMGVMAGLIARVPVEDAALKKQFGQEWTNWAQQVPYAIIPLVY